MIRLLAAMLTVLTAEGLSQSPQLAQYQPKFENDVVAVYQLDLRAHASASAFQSAHDTFWLSLTDATVSFSNQEGKIDLRWQAGDTRFFPSFATQSLINTGATEFRGVLIALKPRGLVSSGCECAGNTGRTVCGCKGGAHLESLWALSLGEVTLAGTSLAAGEAFRAAALRDDMLLVAVTDLNLTDEGVGIQNSNFGEQPVTRLKAGDAIWINGGRHQFKNVGQEAARFVTFEF